jgi:hypothetical protein
MTVIARFVTPAGKDFAVVQSIGTPTGRTLHRLEGMVGNEDGLSLAQIKAKVCRGLERAWGVEQVVRTSQYDAA